MKKLVLLLLLSIGYCRAEQITGNNMPNLAWKAVSCDNYEVWIDGVLAAEVASDRNCYTPFPLSFGEHVWQVYAVRAQSRDLLREETITVDGAPLSDVPEGAQLLRKNWYVRSVAEAGEDGAVLSGILPDMVGWARTSIPATALTALVRNGFYPNPYVGMNNMKIPDIDDTYNDKYDLSIYSHIRGHNPWQSPYWYRTEFELDTCLVGKHVWLNFGEINYRADVWLNGVRVASRETMVGMERSFRFEVTELLKKTGENRLAVAVYPPEPYGEPASEPLLPFAAPGTNMADGMLAKSYTKWDCLGWDWQPAVRDRDMGITEDVWLEATGEIELKDLCLATRLDNAATMFVSATLVNHAPFPGDGRVCVIIDDGQNQVRFEEPYAVSASGETELRWQRVIEHPKLWWPFGYGEQNLYKVSVRAVADTGDQAFVEDITGIRKVETYIGNKERVYRINGRDIYLKGGNWVQDMMLNWTSSRYEKELLLTRNANLNILRVWGPTGIPPRAFYRAADRFGILVWQDFLNDYWGTFNNNPEFRPDSSLYEQITTGVVKKYRNHPSLIIWCGGNEGVNPRQKMITERVLPVYDGITSRHYLKQSDGDGLHGGGPYHTLEPSSYFSDRKLTGFSSEIGPSGIPEYESLQKFIPALGRGPRNTCYPVDSVWAYHDANDWPGTDSRKFSAYDAILRRYYGAENASAAAYAGKAQWVNYDVYRAALEAVNRQLWSSSSGILLWKSNSSWPSLPWQIYDWFLQCHAGYYGVQKAAGMLHLQFNRDSSTMCALNLTAEDRSGLMACVEAYDLKGNELFSQSMAVTLPRNKAVSVPIALPRIQGVYLLRQTLCDGNETLCDNLYWLSEENDFRVLTELAEPRVELEYRKIADDGRRSRYRVEVRNTGDTIAFMLRLKFSGAESGCELLPSFWGENYLTLLPGESRGTEVEIFNEDITEVPTVTWSTYGHAN